MTIGIKTKLVALVTTTFAATSAIAEEYTFNAWLPAQHPLVSEGIVPWLEDVREATNGEVDIQLLPAAVSSPPAAYESVQDGLADFTFIVHSYTPGRFPLSTLAELPFLGNSAESISVAYETLWQDQLAAASNTPGVRVLANFTHGPGQMFTTTGPIEGGSDLEGLKIRTGGGISQEVAELLGAAIVNRPATESYEILSTGIADGIFFPFESTTIFNLHPILTHVTEFDGGMYNVSFAILMSDEAYQSIPEEHRSTFDSLTGIELARRIGAVWDAADAAARAVHVESGTQFSQASPELEQLVREGAGAMEQSWITSASELGLDGEQVLADFRSVIEQNQ